MTPLRHPHKAPVPRSPLSGTRLATSPERRRILYPKSRCRKRPSADDDAEIKHFSSARMIVIVSPGGRQSRGTKWVDINMGAILDESDGNQTEPKTSNAQGALSEELN